MTIYQVINILQEIAKAQPNIRSCGEGDIYEFYNGNPSIEYSTFFVTQGQHSSNENFDNYNLTLFYVDRLTDDETNKLQIQSEGKSLLQNVIGTFCDVYDVDAENVQYQVFTQRFVDNCAGVFATVTFSVMKEWGCDEIYDGLNPNPKPVVNIKNQNKKVDITENGVSSVSYDAGYTGLDTVVIDVQVAGGTGVDAYTKEESDARYAKKSDTYTKQEVDDKGYLTEIPSDYVTDTELEQKGYATSTDLNGKQDVLISGTSIKTINGVSLLGEGNLQIEGGGGEPFDGYTKEQADAKFATIENTYSKTDIDQKGFLTEIPAEYITETELAQKNYTTMAEVEKKGYLTEIPANYVTDETLNSKGYLTSIPSEYVTETELERKGFLTEIPAEYITDTELTQKGFITGKELETKGYLTEVPSTYQTTEQADAKYLQSVPSEYVTDTELSQKNYTTMAEVEAKGYATSGELNGKQETLVSGTNIKTINGNSLLGEGDIQIEGGAVDAYTKKESDEKFSTIAYVDEKLTIITSKLKTI